MGNLTLSMLLSPEQLAAYLWQYALFLAVMFMLLSFATVGKRHKTACLLFAAFLVFIAGFRNQHLTNDTYIYISVFKEFTSGFSYVTGYMESGYILYNKFLAMFSDNAQIVLFFNALITIAGYYFCYTRYATNPYLAFMIFALTPVDGYVRILNLSRQYLAIGILMFAVQFIVKRSLWRYLALVFIAGTFHTAAFTAVILYFLYDIKLKKKYILTSLAVVALLIFTPVMDAFISLMQRTVFTRFVHYHEEGFKAAAAMNALVSLGIFSFIIITYRKYKDKIKMPISPDFLTWTSFVTFCIYAVSMVSPTFDRLAYIFSGITILGFSNFIMLYPARKRLLIIFTICLFFIICSSIFFIYRPEWGMPLPYRFFFQG